MPTIKRRMTFVIEEWMWDALEQYRYDHHLTSRSKAAVELIEIGLKEMKTPSNKPEPRKLDEAKIKKHLQALNDLLSDLEKGSNGNG